jgi:DNA-binding HxlR family transcriptional regulator
LAKTYAQVCPLARTLDLIGDRWTLLIVRDLYFGSTRFKDLLAASPGMPTKILSDRLKLLEAHGLVERRLYSQHPLRASYHLTEAGLSLKPVMETIAEWGLEHVVPERERSAVEQGMRTQFSAAEARLAAE